MKKLLALAILLLSIAPAAHAASPAWLCSLAFHGRAEGAQFIVGNFVTAAKGRLTCVTADGQTVSHKVNIAFNAGPIGPMIAAGDFMFAGATAQINLFSGSPASLLGTYLVESGQAALIGGAGAFVAEKVNPPQVSLQVGIHLTHGIGFDVGVQQMTISAAR